MPHNPVSTFSVEDREAMSRIRLKADNFARSRPSFDAYERLLLLEIRSLSDNEIYETVFSRLLKPSPYTAFQLHEAAPNRDVLMMGTDQRDFFVPLLQAEAERLSDGDPVFDIGCGDGQTTAKAFESIRCKPVANFLDPNEKYVARYEECLRSGLLRLARGQCFIEGIDPFMDRAAEDPAVKALVNNQALAFSVHSIYFSADLVRLVMFILDCLRTGGRAVIIFADEARGYTGTLTRLYLKDRDTEAGEAFRRKIETRHDLFGIHGETISEQVSTSALQRRLCRADFRVHAALAQESRFYGDDLGDMFAFSLLAGLYDVDAGPLADKIAFVKERLFHEPERFDLAVETEGMRATMLSASQPQYYFCLEKT